ncbi:VOC family protein [Aurantivibrio infirmus]
MSFKLEHINIKVPSIAKTQAFLAAAFSDYVERGRGYSESFGHWLHFGNDDTYIALLQTRALGQEQAVLVEPYKYEEDYRLMHVGFVVDDVERLMARLEAKGFSPADTGDLDTHPFRRRVYYLDGNGIEWEFIQYLSDQPTQRNDYLL